MVVPVFTFLDVSPDFLQLAAAYVGYLAGAVGTLSEAPYGSGTSRLGQKFQLVEIFLRFRLVLLRCDERHEHSRLGLRF